MQRQEAANTLGLTVSGVRRLERAGKLHPKKHEPSGFWLFDPDEVRALAKERLRPGTLLTRKSSNELYSTEEAARVFEALDKGKSLTQCVIDCLVMPLAVEALAIVHSRMRGCMYVSKVTLDVINTLPLEGTFPLQGEADLLTVLQAAATDTCRACETKARSYCKPCAIKLVQKM